jgi:hypothetical protein
MAGERNVVEAVGQSVNAWKGGNVTADLTCG